MPTTPGRDDDRFGFDDSRNVLARALGAFVPQTLARRALAVSIETDRERYAPGDPVAFTVAIRNRLPVPATVTTPWRRLWGWTVDGELEASDERVYRSETPGVFSFRGGERKVITHTWNGRFRRSGEGSDERPRWVVPDPGVYELGAFVAVEPPRPGDTVEIRIGDAGSERP